MKILALEFSSAQQSVAVLSCEKEGALTAQCPPEDIVEAVETGRGATHALAMIDEVLREAKVEREQIERLAVGIGPGSYTGIRAAIAVAQGWQLAWKISLVAISSAECLARQICAEGLTGRMNVVIDAQRDEFYMAGYALRAGCHEVAPLRLATLAEVREREQAGEMLIGPEVARCFPSGRVLFPSAAMLARLALERNDFVPGEKIEPIYLRETSFVKVPPPPKKPA